MRPNGPVDSQPVNGRMFYVGSREEGYCAPLHEMWTIYTSVTTRYQRHDVGVKGCAMQAPAVGSVGVGACISSS